MVKDEADTATKCPKCKAARPPKKSAEGEGAKTYMEAICKNTTKVCINRLQDIQADGTMELPKREKEAVAKMKELDDQIKKLDGVEIATVVSAMEDCTKELSALKKKFPRKDLHARDYAEYVGSVADVEEKAAMVEKQLKEKLAKL